MKNLAVYQVEHMIRPTSFFMGDYDIIEKKDGINSFFVRYIHKVTKSGVEVMRTRTNHKANLKKESIDKNFWKEFNKRGFSVDSMNDGVYNKHANQAELIKSTNGRFELKTEASKINIVSAQNFMKTIARIEGMVKYKLFE